MFSVEFLVWMLTVRIISPVFYTLFIIHLMDKTVFAFVQHLETRRRLASLIV